MGPKRCAAFGVGETVGPKQAIRALEPPGVRDHDEHDEHDERSRQARQARCGLQKDIERRICSAPML